MATVRTQWSVSNHITNVDICEPRPVWTCMIVMVVTVFSALVVAE